MSGRLDKEEAKKKINGLLLGYSTFQLIQLITSTLLRISDVMNKNILPLKLK